MEIAVGSKRRQVLTDLRIAEAANHLPQVQVQVVQVGLASPDTAGQAEWDLDTQMSTSMAGNVANLIIYDTTSFTDSDVALMFNKFAQQNIAKAGTASFPRKRSINSVPPSHFPPLG